MSDNDNDIDALLAFLGRMAMPKQHAALTALVAERDKAKSDFSEAWRERSEFAKRIDEADADILALRKRVAELEAQNPSDCEIVQAVMMNREAELRVVCSALAGIYSNPNGVGDPARNGQIAAAAAKAAIAALSQPRAWSTCDPVRDLCGDRDSDLDGEALAAMRKGDSDGK